MAHGITHEVQERGLQPLDQVFIQFRFLAVHDQARFEREVPAEKRVSALRQVTQPGAGPGSQPLASPPSPAAQSAQQLETLGRLISDLNRDVKQLATRVDQIQK